MQTTNDSLTYTCTLKGPTMTDETKISAVTALLAVLHGQIERAGDEDLRRTLRDGAAAVREMRTELGAAKGIIEHQKREIVSRKEALDSSEKRNTGMMDRIRTQAQVIEDLHQEIDNLATKLKAAKSRKAPSQKGGK